MPVSFVCPAFIYLPRPADARSFLLSVLFLLSNKQDAKQNEKVQDDDHQRKQNKTRREKRKGARIPPHPSVLPLFLNSPPFDK
mmetsp:Transcript_40241/g.79332  ORF Transcript_40241/g.79332 Transcript_40241/m.79332 type:complete len:83 (+) Transcript_40241:2165-2413(+)